MVSNIIKHFSPLKMGHYMRAVTSYKGAVNKTTIEAYTYQNESYR